MNGWRPGTEWTPTLEDNAILLRLVARSLVQSEYGPQYVTIRRDALLDAAEELERLTDELESWRARALDPNNQ